MSVIRVSKTLGFVLWKPAALRKCSITGFSRFLWRSRVGEAMVDVVLSEDHCFGRLSCFWFELKSEVEVEASSAKPKVCASGCKKILASVLDSKANT